MIRRPCDPYLDAGLRHWITKTARKQYWRVAAWIGLDDLIQEGMVVFAMCRQKYKVENKAHFMALVKTCYQNRITDMANEHKLREVPFSQLVVQSDTAYRETDVLDHLCGSVPPEQEFQAALSRAPDEIRALMRMLHDPQMCGELQKPLVKRSDGTRETHSERICRLLGIEYVDMEQLLREVLYA